MRGYYHLMINIDAEIFNEFLCKADKCKHSCCKGWEIDIDEDTLEYYKDLDTELGDDIRQNIHEGDETCFELTEDKRCPFLKDSGLCKLIEELGEDALCDICRLHPRFYQSIGDYSLAGVGLSCERTCELLFEKTDLRFIIEEGEKLIDLIELLNLLEINIPKDSLSLSKVVIPYLAEDVVERILEIFYGTEPIDEKWKDEVSFIKDHYKEYLGSLDIEKYEIIYQYILFRQLENVKEYGAERIIDFAAYSTIYIMLYAKSIQDDIEAVRRWSEQIEYCEENTRWVIGV